MEKENKCDALVSVVIPIYNVEKYLNRCILSVVNQTYRNLEIILVDDGSPDNCPRLCDEWSAKDDRIKVIHKKNEGLGFARNTGIEHAHGAYICFFDSDDYVELTLIEECIGLAEKENADIVFFGHDSISQEGKVLNRYIPEPPKDFYEGDEVRRDLLPRLVSYDPETGEDWCLQMSACFTMFSMCMIEACEWRFVSERDIISEDYYAIFQLFAHVEKVVFIRKAFYHYSVNGESLSHIYRRDRVSKLKHWGVAMEQLDIENGYHVRREITTIFLCLLIAAMKQIVRSKETLKAKLSMFQEILQDDYIQGLLHNHNDQGENMGKRLLHKAMIMRSPLMCYCLVFVRNLRG